MDDVEVVPKKFIVVPRDAFDVLRRRCASSEEAIELASQACAEDGQTMYVLEMKAVAVRADRPVTVRKL